MKRTAVFSVVAALGFALAGHVVLAADGYLRVREVGAGKFQTLSAVALDQAGNVYGSGVERMGALAETGSVKMFTADGTVQKQWRVGNAATGLAVDTTGAIYVAGEKAGNGCVVEKLTVAADGKVTRANWALGKAVRSVSSLRVHKDILLVADASTGCVHKISAVDGKYLGKLGGRGAKDGVTINTCCGILGFDVDAAGRLFIGNLGQHRVTACELDGSKESHWGKPSEKEEDFCGCCNPVCVAVMPDGKIVTAEKTIPRIKVYTADGKMVALIGASEFGKDCSDLALAVDAKGVIYAADGEAKSIKVFALKEEGKAEVVPAPISPL